MINQTSILCLACSFHFKLSRRDYLHRACCDVSDLLNEVSSWLTRWPAVMAVEGAHLYEGILDFSYSPELAKLVYGLFTFESLIGHAMGRLHESSSTARGSG
jgi:hypothetical protein